MDTQNKDIIWQDRKHHLWFPLSFTSYYIRNERLLIKHGFLSTTLDETLLYRIVDLTCRQTLLGKLFGTGHLILQTKVDTSREIVLENISKPFETRELFSNLVEEIRRKHNVVGTEFYGPSHQHVDRDGNGICDFDELPK